MLQETRIATRAQDMHVPVALLDKGYISFFSSCLVDMGSISRGGGVASHRGQQQERPRAGSLSFTNIVPGKAAALEIRKDKGGLTLINVHGLQASSLPLAGRAAFWANIQMYATAPCQGGRHPVVIRGETSIYMDATNNPATEHFRSAWEACGFRRAAAGGTEDMTATLHRARLRLETFLVSQPFLPWSLRESSWAWGTAHPYVVGSDHLPVRLILPGSSTPRGRRQYPPDTARSGAVSSRATPKPHPCSAACEQQ